MSPQQKPENPKKRMGVYKSIEDVPERRLLSQFASQYEGRNVWQEYLDEKLYINVKSERVRRDYGYVEERWFEYMDERGTHHALATPSEVEKWAERLVSEFTMGTAYDNWELVERFYRWLMWHVDHPHCYSPFLMAAAKGGASTDIWEFRVGQ